MKFISWNVNGIRACLNKGFIEHFKALDADIFCLQETKAQEAQVKDSLEHLTGYHTYMNSAVRKGYSGTAIFSKEKPLQVTKGIGIEEHDQEGRVLTAEFDAFYFVTVYTPNSGQDLVRLDYREQWDKDFLAYLKKLEETKPVVVCGDLNVCHKDIDIARPKANYNKSAGYTQIEIDGMDNMVNAGFIDTYRHFYPDKTEAYSWWSFRANARANNIGWRLDYFFVSEALKDQLVAAAIHPEIEGSDHCPVELVIQ